MNKPKVGIKVSFNAPVILGFSFLCLLALILAKLTNGRTNVWIFSVYRSSFANPMTYIRMFGHVFGHSGWQHFIGNITFILVIGPLLEEKYGSKNMVILIATTAVVTGIANVIFFPYTRLLRASRLRYLQFVTLLPTQMLLFERKATRQSLPATIR